MAERHEVATTIDSAIESGDLIERYRAVRATTDWPAAPLSPEDATAQAMPDASPTKWHMAHTSWFFETFVLEPSAPGYRLFHPDFRVLFNSYYQAVGAQHPRAERGLITRPGLAEVRAYRQHVDQAMIGLLEGGSASAEIAALVEIGLNHEQQHQELILTDLKYLLSRNPIHPAYRPAASTGAGISGMPGAAAPLTWSRWEEGVRWIGWNGQGFAFDNEGPRHRELIPAFELASRPATCGEYLEFMAAGGYERPELWLSDGWSEVCTQGWRAPLYWQQVDDAWRAHTLAGLREVRPEEPVCHLSFYEADAFARWAGARLPTESEWEVATAEVSPVEGNFLEDGRFHPASPSRKTGSGPAQLFGDVWEWTGSAYLGYPGYRPAEGALGEYNGKFMCNQLVLRGGSCATPRGHVRATYRNFFPPTARWQFSGVRLARDAG